MCALEAREVVDSFGGQSVAGVGVGRQYSHGYEDFNAIRDRGSTALVVFSALALPFLDVDENVSKPPGGRWSHDGFVNAMQLCFNPQANGHYNAPPCVEAITGFDIVERYLLLTVEAEVQMSSQSEG